MKPYSKNPAQAHGTKYARKAKKVLARVDAERAHKKQARSAAKKELRD